VEFHVVDVMANVDNGDFTEKEEDVDFSKITSRGRFQAKLITLAKSEFGLIPRSEANRLMVRKFLRDQMRERGMRPTHIAAHVDVSVSCFFIPSKNDLVAHQVGAAMKTLEMDEKINGEWESIFRPIGRMLGFSVE
jgi:hypothetical protein